MSGEVVVGVCPEFLNKGVALLLFWVTPVPVRKSQDELVQVPKVPFQMLNIRPCFVNN